jgi:hypothetical protein
MNTSSGGKGANTDRSHGPETPPEPGGGGHTVMGIMDQGLSLNLGGGGKAG